MPAKTQSVKLMSDKVQKWTHLAPIGLLEKAGHALHTPFSLYCSSVHPKHPPSFATVGGGHVQSRMDTLPSFAVVRPSPHGVHLPIVSCVPV
jgi:hypothetical protein